ncbi:MAG: hypothetical protein WC867_03225 [Candidatus Pacearchaeota archaeon]
MEVQQYKLVRKEEVKEKNIVPDLEYTGEFPKFEIDEYNNIVKSKRKYCGYLQKGNRMVGNSELREIKLGSDDNLDMEHKWYIISDFYIEPEFRGKGFEKVLVDRLTNFARVSKVGIVQKIKCIPGMESRLDPLVELLENNGFERFDEKTLYYTHDGAYIGDIRPDDTVIHIEGGTEKC